MKNIHINSKYVKKGDVFVGISCENLQKNITEAIEKGASVIFAEKSENDKVIIVNDARLTASKLAKFRYSKQPEICVSITGTNGKSSVSHFLKQIWYNLGLKAANLGTLGLFIGDSNIKPNGIEIQNLTTPDAITLHKIMEYLYDISVSNFVFEASSHALDQKRLHSVSLNAAAFNNFASDHLDYHKSKESYFNSKIRLFKEILNPSNPAIVSLDFPEIYENVLKFNKNIISFGMSEKNYIRAENVSLTSNKINIDLLCGDKKFEKVEVNLFGEFQIMNVLCAVALAFSTGSAIDQIVETLPKIKPLNGRMEHVKSYNGGYIYIDYAHTTEGFRNALECFKKVCSGRLICVFGCGGNRDKSKRPELGEIAFNLADIVIVTDDNPRTEDPSKIRAEITQKCKTAIEIGDRSLAIKYAIEIINQGDFVVIIGKGHEITQIFHDKTINFNDKEEVLKILDFS